jgi:hypothetical protein
VPRLGFVVNIIFFVKHLLAISGRVEFSSSALHALLPFYLRRQYLGSPWDYIFSRSNHAALVYSFHLGIQLKWLGFIKSFYVYCSFALEAAPLAQHAPF